MIGCMAQKYEVGELDIERRSKNKYNKGFVFIPYILRLISNSNFLPPTPMSYSYFQLQMPTSIHNTSILLC